MTVMSLIIRTTLACNLGCRYCYVDRTRNNTIIPLDFINELFEGLAKSGYDVLNIYWHGGEPLLASRNFYRQAIEIGAKVSRENKIKIDHKMQTNATLIDQDWINFFLENDFKVGTSLDGLPEINDANRINLGGRSSFDDAVRGINLMKQNGMNTSMLSVLTREHLTHLDEHYEFVKKLGVDTFKVNPCIVNKVEEAHLQVLPIEWGEAMCHLFDLWYDDPHPPYNREFQSMVKAFFLGRHSLCLHCRTCFVNFLSISPNGDMFPCAKLINNDTQFHLGNITQGVKAILERYKSLNRDYDHIEECNSCKWKAICNSGCTAYAYWENGDINTPDYLCEGYKILYEHAYERVQQTLGRQND